MSAAISTAAKMLESLPEAERKQVVERLREYVAELQDDRQWDALFEKTEARLIEAAQRARKEIAEGRAEPLDPDRL
jgi:hypothetical protein